MENPEALLKAIFFRKIATKLAERSPSAIKKHRKYPNIPNTPAYQLACTHVANFLYNHGMEMAVFIANRETSSFIPKRDLPIPIGHKISLSNRRNLYQQLKRSIKTPPINSILAGGKEFRQHHHHNHVHKEDKMYQ